MKTGCFKTYAGPGRICIARYAPRGTPPGFRIHSALAPRADMLKMSRERYVPIYRSILAALDPQEQWDILHDKAGDHEPVLLCWEKPPFNARNWCHRRLVAEWFGETLGVTVPEIMV